MKPVNNIGEYEVTGIRKKQHHCLTIYDTKLQLGFLVPALEEGVFQYLPTSLITFQALSLVMGRRTKEIYQAYTNAFQGL